MASRPVLRYSSAIFALFLFIFPALADTTVTFIDVGQGDPIWIHADAGYDVPIDGERDRGPLAMNYLKDVPDLDVVLWTHAHADRIGGVVDVTAEAGGPSPAQ